MILGRLKVKIESKNHGFPCVFPIEIIMGKSSLPTLTRPKITENEKFLDRSKTSFNTLLELPENGFLGPQVVREWFGSWLSSYTHPSAHVSNNYLHIRFYGGLRKPCPLAGFMKEIN